MSASQPQPLFADGQLSKYLASVTRIAVDFLLDWDPDDLLSTSETDVTEILIRLATPEAPALARDNAFLETPAEVTLDGNQFSRSARTITTRFTLVVPFTGDPAMFRMRARTWSPVAVYGEIDEVDEIDGDTLRLYCDNLTGAARVRDHFERQLDLIEQQLARIRTDVEAHHQLMAREMPGGVARRRAKLLSDLNLHASIGYPIKERPDASNYTVPIRRKIIAPPRTPRTGQPLTTNPYRPEPALAHADYEAALAVLRNARNALERSPSMSSKLDEQEVRDLLLVALNAQFEGNAAGEVFNCTGKTDILIREEDRNVFIGECKIFDARYKQSVEAIVSKALDQLLGYLVWRDTKAALLLFIRDTDVHAIVDRALHTIRSHPSYKRPGKISSEERNDFVIHANGDQNREIHLAFLPFLIGGRKTR